MSWSINSIPYLTGKTVLVTGANSGIGFEAVKVFAKKGAHVIMACRNPERGNAAVEAIKADFPPASLELMTLDLNSLLSVRRFSDAIKQQYERIDILVNNAGVMGVPLTRTVEGFETHFGCNHLAHFALTARLLPLLENSADGRIVVVASVFHRVGRLNLRDLNWDKHYFRWGAYAQSKLANLMFAKELQRRLRQQNSAIRVVAVHPGYSSTNLQRYVTGANLFNMLFSQPQQQGALPTLFGATHPDLKGGEYIGPNGFLELKGMPAPAYASALANNEHAARRLWEESERLTGESFLSIT